MVSRLVMQRKFLILSSAQQGTIDQMGTKIQSLESQIRTLRSILGTKSSDLATLEEKRRQCEEIEQTRDVLLRTIQSLRQSASLHEANMRSAVVESTNIYIKMSQAAGDL